MGGRGGEGGVGKLPFKIRGQFHRAAKQRIVLSKYFC